MRSLEEIRAENGLRAEAERVTRKRQERFLQSRRFCLWVDENFDEVLKCCTTEDLATFAFGGLAEAVEAYRKVRGKKVRAGYRSRARPGRPHENPPPPDLTKMSGGVKA